MKLFECRRKAKERYRLMLFFFMLPFFVFFSVPIIVFASSTEEKETVAALLAAQDITGTSAPESASLHAYSAVLYDAEAGRVLYEKNGYEVLPMASTTKIMTLLVVLENSEPQEIVTVSKNAAMQPDVQLNMNTGEQYYVKDLCYSLMLESHNDTAVALAEHVGGSVEGFAAMMNAKAKALGAFSANFVTPNGLDAEEHGIAAADLAKIAAYAVKQEEFRKITNTASYSFSELTGGRSFTVNNKDAFLNMMEGAIGVKTGFTGKAGYCFVGAVEREDRLLISVVLASGWPPNKTYKWQDTMKLMKYGIHSFQKLPVLETTEKLPELPKLPVQKGQNESVSLSYDEEELAALFGLRLLRTGKETVVFTPELETTVLTAPVESGRTVGTLIVRIDEDCIQKIPIQTAEAVVPVDFEFYLKQLVRCFFSGDAVKRLFFQQE